jgi:large subunit ribosomal protein L4
MVFAPVPRNYSFKINKKEKQAAMKSALTDRLNDQKLIVLDELKLDEIKTKAFVNVLNNLKVEKALVVLPEVDEKVMASAKNVKSVKATQTGALSVYDILKYNTVVLTKDAVKKIEEVYA